MALRTVAKPGTRAFNDIVDERAAELVRAFLSAPQTADEDQVRRALAGLVAEAEVPQQVARSLVASYGLSNDVVADLVGRLQVYLLQNVADKLELQRLLSSSLCGWARKLLLRQARTAFRSEQRSKRAQPVVDISAPTAPKRPGVRPIVHLVSVDPTDDIDDELSEEFVLAARRSCRKENDVHLVEWLLRKKYGFRPQPRLADFANCGNFRNLDEDDREALSRQAMEAVRTSASTLHHPPSGAVAKRFTLLVTGAVDDEELAGALAQVWLAKWVEVKTTGTPKTSRERRRDAARWGQLADVAVTRKVLGARSVSRLEQVMEDLFWQAHCRATSRLAA
jgi:hypothetical protein